MKSSAALILITSAMLGACGPHVDLTQTAVVEVQAAAQTMAVQTQESARGQAGTAAVAVPGVSSPTVEPAATATLAASPTSSGTYEFFDVEVDQVAPDEVDVSFGFQLDQNVHLGEIQLGAWPVGCDDLTFSLSLVPDIPFSYSGWVKGDDVVQLSLDGPGKCESKAIRLMVYEPNQPGNLYQQTFDIPFSLEK
jgi:hypothetical protein